MLFRLSRFVSDTRFRAASRPVSRSLFGQLSQTPSAAAVRTRTGTLARLGSHLGILLALAACTPVAQAQPGLPKIGAQCIPPLGNGNDCTANDLGIGQIKDLSEVDILADCADWDCRPVKVSIC